jgi:hypothetical protein
MLLGTYFAAGMLLLLRGSTRVAVGAAARAICCTAPRAPSVGRGMRVFLMYIVRTVVLVAVGLPYVMAAVMVTGRRSRRWTTRACSSGSISSASSLRRATGRGWSGGGCPRSVAFRCAVGA